MVKLMRFDM